MRAVIKKVVSFVLVLSLLNIQPITVTAVTTVGETQVSYDEIIIENNANLNDYVNFKNLKYVLDEDKASSCVVTIYDDAAKTKKLKTATINYSYFTGKDYSLSVGKLFAKEAGCVYLAFKYTKKQESEVIKVNYAAERTSPALNMDNITVENRYNGTSEKIYVNVTGLSSGDYIYIYKKNDNETYSLLGSLLSGSTGTVSGNYTRTTGLNTIYFTQKKKNEYESEVKQPVIVPEAGVTTFGSVWTDYPDAQVIAKDQTGNDFVEITGVGTGTIVTIYSDEAKLKKIKSQTINTNGRISISNILSYEYIYVAFRAPDKYESVAKKIAPIPAEKTYLTYDNIEILNNSGTNDYIKFTNLKYTDEADQKSGVTFTLYADENGTNKIYSGSIGYSILQGDKESSYNVGKIFGENGGIAYLGFKYATKKESNLIPISYEEEKYSPNIKEGDVKIVNKYTGTKEQVYVTVNNLQSGDIVYLYKLLSNGTYSQITTATCSSTSTSISVNFANPSDASCIYLQMKRTNQYVCKEKTMVEIPIAGVTSFGTENTDLPELSIIPVDNTGSDFLEIYGAVSNTKFQVYSDAQKINRITSATINSSGNIAIKNIMNYEAIYVTVRVPDKYESEVIRIIPIAAPKSRINYERVYINNYTSDVGDSLCFDGLMYADEEDKKISPTIKVYADQEKTTVLYAGLVPYSKLYGTDYSISLSNKLGLESGILYISVKYPSKRESDLISVAYDGEKTSSKVNLSNVFLENDLTRDDLAKSKVKVRVTNLAKEDVIKVYLTNESKDILANNNGEFVVPVATKSVYLTIQNYGCYESERTEVELPKARSCKTISKNVKVENNAGIYSDRVSYSEDSEIPEGTIFSVYQYQQVESDEKQYVKIGSTSVSHNRAVVVFDYNGTLGEEKGRIYTTLTYPGYRESEFNMIDYDEELLFMRIGIVESDANKLTIKNTQEGDIIRIYGDEEKNNLLAETVSTGLKTEIELSTVKAGDIIYITNQSVDRTESKILKYNIGNICKNREITMDEDYNTTTYSVEVDFSTCEQGLIGIVRKSGGSSAAIEVFDQTGKKVGRKIVARNDGVSDVMYKRWITLDKPEGETGKHVYNIRISQTDYINSTSCKLIVGDAKDARSLLGGIDNAVEIKPYVDKHSDNTKGGNIIHGEYVPRGGKDEGYFYYFTYWGETITLCTIKANLGFRIYNQNEEIVYDSIEDTYADRTKWKDVFSCVKKANTSLKSVLNLGQTYYIEVYSTQNKDFVEDMYSYYLAVGDPFMTIGFDTIYATRALTVPAGQFSSVLPINAQGENIPNTALVKEITPKDNSARTAFDLVNILKFRVRNTTDNNMWHTCSGFYSSCKFYMAVNSPTSTHLKGRWEIEVYSKKEMTIVPGFFVEYYFEIGD